MNDNNLNVGQDSFLDIVANLVGILIILVMVVGAHAQSEWSQREPNEDLWQQVESLTQEVETTATVARSVQLENHEYEQKIATQASLMLSLDQERHEMLVQLAMAKQEVENLRAEQSSEQNKINDAQAELLRNLQELEHAERSLKNLQTESQKTEVETIEHYPTPIAKTVFSNEVHFLLSRGKIDYIPMDELVGLMKSQWRLAAEKLTNAEKTMETVGPIDGYRLQYHLVAEAIEVNSPVGVTEQRQTRFDHFDVLPLSTNLGENMVVALERGSEFIERLARLQPANTTISVWVYPDSYRELADLKRFLRQQGFQIANWPLQFGKTVSGGPRGFRASAQ